MGDDPIEILKQRIASGEISINEFKDFAIWQARTIYNNKKFKKLLRISRYKH
jgi:hypothetical protein